MSTWQDAFNNAAADVKKEYKTVTPGTYKATITDCDLDHETGILNWEFTIIDGEFTNRKLWQRQDLGKRPEFVKQNFQLLLIPVNSADELMTAMAQAIGRDVEVFVQHKPNPNNKDKPYVNTYINRLLNQTELDFNKDEPLGF